MQQKFFSVPFAIGGDTTPIGDAIDPTGLVSFTQGWGPDYQADKTVYPATAKDVDRASTNYMFNVITAALAALQAVGVPEWIAAADNDGAAYPYVQGAEVRFSATPSTGPWVFYTSLVNNNTDTPPSANWQVSLKYESSSAQALAGTDNSTIMTPRRVAQAVAQGVTPLGVQVGMVAFFAATTVQTGYLPADGSIVSRTTFAALFAYMGTTFGAGDGTTTFQLPDLRGKFARAWDNGAGIDPSRVFGSYIADSIRAHNHAVNDSGHTHVLNNPSHTHAITDSGHSHKSFRTAGDTYGLGNGGPPAEAFGSSDTGTSVTGISLAAATTAVTANSTTTGITTANTGGTETAPKNVALLACIKY